MAGLTPRDPDWHARFLASFAAQRVMASFGVRVAEAAPGAVTLEMPFRDDLVQQHGFLHAGIITTVLDSACGYAAFTLMDPEAEVLTVEFKANFTAPARGALFRCAGEVVQSGRNLSVVRGAAHALGDGEPRLVATMQATMMAVRGRADTAAGRG